ncbi:MAG TPA: VWA containing CoxE family protein [Acidobacteriota bacterium]|nr:VWA containing CoxE family protein [Acidobacteriota bacterium]
MFYNLFHSLRRHGVPVTFNEWLVLQKALSENLADSSLTRFYYLARAIMIKTEAHFDKFDQAFLECFGHIETSEELIRTIEEHLLRMPPLDLTEEEKRMLEALDLEELRGRFLDQLRTQDDEPHVGGNKAIGVRGRSPFGAWGYNPAGVRIGQYESRMHSAIQIAEKRSFKNYRDDIALDTRSMKTALSYIRQVVREGPKDSLDVDGTIDATCRNAGELEFIWERAKKKRIKLMLLMDAGGTMTPHAELVSRLFSAAKDVVKDLQFYYFHNCVYQELYTDIHQMKAVPTRKVLDQMNRNYKVILVGDAYMAPSELMSPNGAIDYWYQNDRPGIEWLIDIRKRFRKAIWLNPEPSTWWPSVPSTRTIQKIFPMYELTLEGMRAGARALIKQ